MTIGWEPPDPGLVRRYVSAVVAAADQRWYWTEDWQVGEREADEDLKAGRSVLFEGGGAFLKSLGS